MKIREGIEDRIILNPSMPADMYGTFLNNTKPGDSPSYMKFYFFNITNLESVRQFGEKPILEELGPYTYRQYLVRYDVDFDFSGRVHFKDFKFYIEEPEMTQGSFDDVIFTLNVPLVGALSSIQQNSGLVRWLLAAIIQKISSWSDGHAMGLFTRRSVDELLWGYQDPLLKYLKTFVAVDDNVAFFENYTIADGDGRINTMHTGFRDISLLGQMEEYEGQHKFKWTNHYEVVRGTDGTRFNPKMVNVGATLDVWVGELFRSLQFTSEQQLDFSGVDVIRFELDETVLQEDKHYDQSIYGLLNITTPMEDTTAGAPIYMSLPHYCRASKELLEGVTGLKCEEEQHTLFIDVEPNTGLAVRGAKRLMLSSEYGPQFSSVEPNIRHTFLPIFWVDGEEQASDDQLDLLKDSIYWAYDVLKVAKAMTLAGAIAFGLLSVIFISCEFLRCYKRRRASKDSIKKPEESAKSTVSGKSTVIDLAPPRRDISEEAIGSPLFGRHHHDEHARAMESAQPWNYTAPGFPVISAASADRVIHSV